MAVAGDSTSGRAMDAATGALLSRYLVAPDARREEVIALARRGGADLPSATLLVVADAYMRDGDLIAAGNVFARILERGEGPPWSSFAELGLVWVATAQGDVPAARVHLAALARAPGPQSADLVAVTAALLDAYEGRGATAAAALDALAVAPETAGVLRMVARMGGAYARHWSGDEAGAAAAFDAAAIEYPLSPLADDARYAAAWARWRSERMLPRAVRELRAVAALPRSSRGHGPTTRAMIELEPDAVLAAGLRRYRGPTAGPAERLASAMDLDGARLARAALRLLDRGGESDDLVVAAAASGDVGVAPLVGPAPVAAPASDGSGAAHGAGGRITASAGRAATPTSDPEAGRPGLDAPWLLAAALALVAAIIAASRFNRSRA